VRNQVWNNCFFLTLGLGFLFSCGTGAAGADAGMVPVDSGSTPMFDGGLIDGGLPLDASVTEFDAGDVDSGTLDAGSADAGTAEDAGSDAGTSDAGAGIVDSGPFDAGTADSGTTLDAGAFDAGTPDASIIDGGIINPYYTTGRWKLWTENALPVGYSGYNLNDPNLQDASFTIIDAGLRRFPDVLVNAYPSPFISLPISPNQPAVAGFWDDVYATRDGAHTGLSGAWSDSFGNTANMANQFVRVGFGICQPNDILRLGVNFTSESFSNSGHQLISPAFQVTYTEQYFSFVNTVRATPAYLSFAETIADRSIDSYDALFSHSFNSVGRSGSESGALNKMLLAGGYMPRATKDLLKKHGAYGLALINIFRQTLPYAEADLTPVNMGSEMLQRPAYFSNGNNTSQEFVPRNAVFHQYDESQHVFRMIQAARVMTVAPPVAIVKILGITVELGGNVIVNNAPNDVRIKGNSKTLARIWGNPGETITVRVEVNGSYDLQNRNLTYLWQQVYAEQKNVTVSQESATVYKIKVVHNAQLPKGRIPVALFVNNGINSSGPAFVNFYWPEAGQLETPGYVNQSNPISLTEVQKNKRPIFSTNLATDYLNVVPGSSAAFDVSCTDPEMFNVKFYRWLGEQGTFSGTHFGYTAAISNPGFVYPIHLVCSDGTGGTESLLVRVAVTPNDGPLPGTFKSTVFGLPEASGSVSFDAGVDGGFFEVVGNGPAVSSEDHGRIVFENKTGDIELTAQVLDFSIDGTTTSIAAKGGVMLRESLVGGSRSVFSFVQGNKKSATPLRLGGHVRSAKDSVPQTNLNNPTISTAPNFVKAMRRGSFLAGFGSSDGINWEQLACGITLSPSASISAGLAVMSNDNIRGDVISYARGKFKIVNEASISIPLVSLTGTLVANNTMNYKTTVNVEFKAAQTAHEIRYTLDGTDPTSNSLLYVAPFAFTTVGNTTIKAKSFLNGSGSGTTVLQFTVTP
jgi:hypothetical protein